MGNMTNGFFDTLEAAATWSAGVAFQRSKGLPLDKYSVFETKALAEEYAEKRGAYAETPVSYPGQVIAVAEGDKMVAYVLAESADGTKLELQQIGIIPTGDDKSIEVTADGVISLKGAAQATAGQQPRIVNKGTAEEPKLEIEWYTPDNSTVAGLQDTVGAIKETVDGIVEDDGTVTKEGLIHRVNGLEAKVGVAANGDDEATGLYKEIADEKARALEAEKALDDAIKAIDFIDGDELAEAIKDFTTKKYVDDALALKADITYVDGEIDKIEEAIGKLNHFKAEVVTDKSKMTEVGVLYLFKVESANGSDVYEEYIVVDGEATLIGDTTTDLSNYYNKTEVDGKFTTEKEAREALAEEVEALKAVDNATQEELDAYKLVVTSDIATAKGEAIADADGKLALKANAADVYTKDEIAGLNHATKTEVENAVKAEADIARAAEKANADAITAIKDHESVDSFADVVAELAKKQDKLTEGAYATESYVDGKVKALADGAVAEAKAQADKGVADAKIAKDAADAAQADADTNALNIQEIEKEINGYTIGEGEEAQQVDGLLTKVANNTARIGTLEGTIAGHTTQIGEINTALAGKAEQSALNDTNGRVTALEDTVNNESTGLVKKVADNATAIQGIIDTMATDDEVAGVKEELEGSIETLGGRVDDVEDEIETLKGDASTDGSVSKAIKDAIDGLDVIESTDSDGVIISSIKQEDGKISVSRRAIMPEDVPTLPWNKISASENYLLDEYLDIHDMRIGNVETEVGGKLSTTDFNGTIGTVPSGYDEESDTYKWENLVEYIDYQNDAQDVAIASNANAIAALQTAQAGGLVRSIVTELPAVADAKDNVVYMIKRTAGLNGKDVYDEYILVEVEVEGVKAKQFELLGNTELDLSNYYDKAYIDDIKLLVDDLYDGDSAAAWADKADNDGDGNNIVETYETKEDASAKLAEAKGYTDAAKAEAIEAAGTDAANKAAVVLSEAQKYADGLAGNYATAEQGAKADTAIQSVAAGTGLKATIDKNDATKVTLDIDDSVVFIFDGGSASSAW